MQILEKGYWNSSPVKNYGSVFYLIPRGNSTLFNGPFIKEFGLKYFVVDEKAVEVPHDESLRLFFDHEPGSTAARFKNFICPFMSLEMEMIAAGADSFLLRYTLHNRAFEDKQVKLFFDFLADREVEKTDISATNVDFTFDLTNKKTKHGEGTIDFSSLREWFIDSDKLKINVGFQGGKPETVQEIISSPSYNKIVAEGIELEDEIFVPAGQSKSYELTLSFGKNTDNKSNAVTAIWDKFSKSLPEPEFNSSDERMAYYKSWYILFFNEVKRKGLHWCLTGLGFPSMWVWDTSPFIADAYMNISPEFVQNLISAQLDSLKETGMMPLHVIMGLESKKESKEEITQMPLVAQAAWKVFEKTRDISFAKKAYNCLQLNYDWYEKRRKPKADIPLWGIDDKRAPYHYGPESGMDNCPIYDNGPAYSVAINSAKCSFEQAMSNFALVLEENEKSQIWEDRFEKTKQFMLKNMWDKADSYYYALTYDLEKIRLKTSDIYPALYLGLFPEENVKLIAEVFKDQFLTEYGLTTVSMKEKCFDPSLYALGSVWPFMNYMAYNGLMTAQCFDLAEDVLKGTIRALSQFPGVFECYNPQEHTLGRLKDGPICIPHMSFCAAGVVSMFLLKNKTLMNSKKID